jgi:hypothetical protein
MSELLPTLDEAPRSSRGAVRAGDPVLQRILRADPHNLDAALRLATSLLVARPRAQGRGALPRGGGDRAELAGRPHLPRAALRAHEGLGRAVPLLEQVVQESPGPATAVEALAGLKARRGGGDGRGRPPAAVRRFERARALQGAAFRNDLELGVLYLDARASRTRARALDRADRERRTTRWRSSSARR